MLAVMSYVTESVIRQLPDSWGWRNTLKVQRVHLSTYSAEYAQVKHEFCSTLPGESIHKIERIESAHLYGMYLLKKAEYLLKSTEYGMPVSELRLWHATSSSNCDQILETGLDWRRASRVKFGQGVSFSPSALYANQQCNRRTPSDRVSILCQVLVKRKAYGSHCTVLPANGVDTSTDSIGNVLVKYDDYEHYPLYVVHHHY